MLKSASLQPFSKLLQTRRPAKLTLMFKDDGPSIFLFPVEQS